MATGNDGNDFGRALAALRRVKGLQSKQLAAKLALVPRTLSRWELGQSTPGVDVRAAIVNWLRAQPEPEARRALVALGALFVEAPSAAPAAGAVARALSTEETKRVKVAIEHAIYKAAEAGNVPAKTARQIAIAALEAVESERLSPGQARGMLSAAKAK